MSLDMNKTFFLPQQGKKARWTVIDATNQIVGRLATKIADILRGKNNAYYTPHTDSGDYVVIINAQKITFTGKKWTDKIYDRYTGWAGGYRVTTARDLHAKKPTEILYKAVERMLPKNILSNQVFKKLKIYAGSDHPHQAQLKSV